VRASRSSSFHRDVLARIRQRVATARIVIAELSGANPNVYLEVGYAWGCRRQTIFIAKKGETIRFDVQGQRRIEYRSIRDLERALSSELKGLLAE
jgi:hypothetical protein